MLLSLVTYSMTDLQYHAEILGLDDRSPITRNEVEVSFKHHARAMHPDKGGHPDDFRMIYTARVALLEALDAAESGEATEAAETAEAAEPVALVKRKHKRAGDAVKQREYKRRREHHRKQRKQLEHQQAAMEAPWRQHGNFDSWHAKLLSQVD